MASKDVEGEEVVEVKGKRSLTQGVDGEYYVEYSRNGRASCKEFRCKKVHPLILIALTITQRLVTGELRIGVFHDYDNDHTQETVSLGITPSASPRLSTMPPTATVGSTP